jgi:hypothetical protein
MKLQRTGNAIGLITQADSLLATARPAPLAPALARGLAEVALAYFEPFSRTA